MQFSTRLLSGKRFLSQSTRVTLFTRVNCSLCDKAKAVVSNVQAQNPFRFENIDIMAKGHEEWKQKYEFDVPVIHVERAEKGAKLENVPPAQKLMHRFSEQELGSLIARTEGTER